MSSLVTRERSEPGAPVLVVTNIWPHRENPAYGIFVKRQVDSLVDAGLRCDVVFIRGFRTPLAYAVAALCFLGLNLRRRGYALVHAHEGETALAARFYLRAPLLVSYCGDDLLGTPRADGTVPARHRLRRWLIRQHSRLVSATLTKSRQMQAALPAPKREANAVVPNGVDRELFAPRDRDVARAELGWGAEERVALFAGDPAVARKRHWLALRACEDASVALGPVRLHVASRVGPEEMPVLMSAADCLLFTSSIEGSPNVVKEALMCDLPVVSTRVGDVPELLDGVEPSWLCDADPESLGTALAECLREPRRSNGRQRSAGLASERTAARILALYEQVAPRCAA